MIHTTQLAFQLKTHIPKIKAKRKRTIKNIRRYTLVIIINNHNSDTFQQQDLDR